METFFQLAVSGIAVGSIYGLIALGFLVIYNATGLVNFAQGQVLMVGSMSALLILMRMDLGYPVTIIGVIIIGLLLAYIFRYGMYQPIERRGASSLHMVVATIAVGLVLTEIFAISMGSDRYGVDPLIGGNALKFMGVSIQPQILLILVVAWLLVGIVWFFFKKTLTGISLRAIGYNKIAAQVTGVRVSRMITLSFVVSIVITVIAGMLIAPILGAGVSMGIQLAVKGFAAAVIGGMSSVYLGMLAGVGLGLLEQMGSYYVSTEWAPTLAYIALLVAIIVMPAKVRLKGAE